MYVSIASWGADRSSQNKKSGIYLINFDAKQIEPVYEMTVLDRHRGFAGFSFDGDRIYAGCLASNDHDIVVALNRKNGTVEGTFEKEGLFDIHQVDCFGEHLWICNTNKYEIVTITRKNLMEVQRWKVFDNFRDELLLNQREKDRFGDPRKRVHMNSIRVNNTGCQIGHFGAEEGAFDSAQLTSLTWNGSTSATMSVKHDREVSHMNFPHNVYKDNEGRLFACISGDGRVVIRGASVQIGGWVRGVALTNEYAFIGVSSTSYYGVSGPARSMEIVKVRLETMEIQDRFIFPEPGQIYDVRVISEPDYGMSSPVW